MRTGLVIVAAGSSRRMDDIDKVWTPIGGKPVVWHSLHALSALVEQTVLVVRSQSVSHAQELAAAFTNVRVTAGGSERHESVRRGLESLEDVDAIVVHDAARPFAPARLLTAGLEVLRNYDGAIPCLPVADTVKQVEPTGSVVTTVDRKNLRASQTPQAFNARVLREVYFGWSSDALPTDDAFMLELEGHPVSTFPGAPEAFKITSDWDLRLARLLFDSGYLT